MKKRSMILVTSMMLAVLLIAGGTFAFFTAETAPIENKFTAGTLRLELNERFTDKINVNPGDCFTKDVWICNTGSKRAVVRVKISEIFMGADGESWLDNGVVTATLAPGWFERNGYYVYCRVLMPGCCTTKLFKDCGICFSREMNNDYQGATYTMTVTGEAIQATHGAPGGWGVTLRGYDESRSEADGMDSENDGINGDTEVY